MTLSTEQKEGSCGYELLLPELSGLDLPGASWHAMFGVLSCCQTTSAILSKTYIQVLAPVSSWKLPARERG